RWSAWQQSRPCRDAPKRGRSLCCGAEAPSRAPISCSSGSQDKRRLSIRHRSPRAAMSAMSSYKSDREMGLSMSPTTSPLRSYSTHSGRIADLQRRARLEPNSTFDCSLDSLRSDALAEHEGPQRLTDFFG